MNTLLNKRLYLFVNATPASRALPESSSRDTYSHDIFLMTNTILSAPPGRGCLSTRLFEIDVRSLTEDLLYLAQFDGADGCGPIVHWGFA